MKTLFPPFVRQRPGEAGFVCPPTLRGSCWIFDYWIFQSHFLDKVGAEQTTLSRTLAGGIRRVWSRQKLASVGKEKGKTVVREKLGSYL